MRVYELAHELGLGSKEVLAKCREIGLSQTNRLAGIKPDEADAVRNACTVKRRTRAAKPAAPKVKKAPSVRLTQRVPSTKKAGAKASSSGAEAAAPAVKKPLPASVKAKSKAKAKTAKPRGKKPPVVAPPPAAQMLQGDASRGIESPSARRGRRARAAASHLGDDLLGVEPRPVLGRYIPPSAIPRYPRRAARRSRGRRPRRLISTEAIQRPTSFTVTAPISVKDLSATIGVKANIILLKLMQQGSMITINAMVNAEQIEFVGKELELEITVREAATAESALEAIEQQADRPEDLKPRAPVVTFLGHVDHGKTSLLDRIRSTDVVSSEHGGITQHIGAYRLTVDDKAVVFLDTPGHEAFTAMRARGANVTDIAVLVVAADDGVMPQTEEAIDHARAADVPVVVAINKCDKPEANPLRVKQQLANLGLQSEDWGGDTVCVDVSAVTGQGVDELVEMLALVAELRELKANLDKPARGTVLEARVSGSRGPVATVLVQEGTLRLGQVIVCGATYGRVKALFDDRGRWLKEAGPSWPVAVVGLDDVPAAGDRLVVMDDIQAARAVAEERRLKQRDEAVTRREHVTLENLFASIEEGSVRELLLILKADVRGTLEALLEVIAGIASDEVKTRVLRSSAGGITTSDVLLADASDAIIVGLNVAPDPGARALAEEKGVAIRVYDVIYRVKEEIKKALTGMLAPEEREVVAGHAEIRRIFRTSRFGNVAGCFVMDGLVARNHRARLIREGTVVYEGRTSSLRREKDDVREVREGLECGILLDAFNDVKEGDIIETFQIEMIARTLGPDDAAAKPPSS